MSSKSAVVVSAVNAPSVRKAAVQKSPLKPAAALTAVPAPAKIAVAPCSKCGRVNSHGSDCRSAAACAARRKDAKPAVNKKGGA